VPDDLDSARRGSGESLVHPSSRASSTRSTGRWSGSATAPPPESTLLTPVAAGRAWSFLDRDLAGVFDMEVWPPFRRRGVGTALLRTVCDAARRAGARHAVLNATPLGKLLYESAGFTQIGEGITWWHHLDDQ
jgi:GNAT superfamily N-acetyltransferase